MPKNPGYRSMAIAALCRSLLNDPDVRVRCSVAKALGQIGSEEVIPTLLEALKVFFPFLSIPMETVRGFIETE